MIDNVNDIAFLRLSGGSAALQFPREVIGRRSAGFLAGSVRICSLD